MVVLALIMTWLFLGLSGVILGTKGYPEWPERWLVISTVALGPLGLFSVVLAVLLSPDGD